MEPRELTSGLWRWTAPHPEWRARAAPGSPDDWPHDVGCALFETASTTVFIDPLLPEDREAFWRWADQRCAGRPVCVLTTISYHSRSRDVVRERYGAASYGEDDAASATAPPLPHGVQCLRVERHAETLVWLARVDTLIAGDTIISPQPGTLSLCPESWLTSAGVGLSRAELRDRIDELVGQLPVERVLVSHGEPVLSGARAALSGALAR